MTLWLTGGKCSSQLRQPQSKQELMVIRAIGAVCEGGI